MKEQLRKRLAGYQSLLKAVHESGSKLSTASKGAERERFVELFLSQMFPAAFRFGTGDITDQSGHLSGQVDVVVEFPFLPSFPLAGTQTSRLYLAEGVAAAIEVRSDLKKQWPQVIEKASKLAELQRESVAQAYGGDLPTPDRIPLFVVGYTGWSKPKTLAQHLADGPISAALVIESCAFATSKPFDTGHSSGPAGLLNFLSCLWQLTSGPFIPACDPCRYL